MQTDSPGHTTTESPQIVARRENVPPKLSGKNTHRVSGATRFYDAAHWDDLAAKHLPRHDLPAWDVSCSPEAMARWLDRLNLTEKQYSQAANTGLADFCALNPTWPLRAWIGSVLELDQERRGG